MLLRPAGDAAILVEFESPDEVLPFAAAVRADPHPAVTDVVPAECTVLVRFDAPTAGRGDRPGRTGRAVAVAAWLGTLRPGPVLTPSGPPVRLDVVYDGDDLAEVARLTGLSPAEVVSVHTATEWMVAFSGFAPGFGYLRPVLPAPGRPASPTTGPTAHRLVVPRRDEPRARVPAGAVALAAGYSGVYPRPSPGGWQVIGHCDQELWNPDRDPPAVLVPGARVRFRDLEGRRSRRAGLRRPSSVPPTHPSEGSGPRRALEVVATGPLTTVQDLGRAGWAHLGVPTSGAADRGSFRLANRLVGNVEGAPALEVTVGGLEVRAVRDLLVAVTGALCPLTLGDRPAPTKALLTLPAGSVLRLGPAVAGVRAYLAVRGGLDVPAVLGSASTDLLGGLGPARPVAGDRIRIGSQVAGWPVVDLAPLDDPPTGDVRLRMSPGPRASVLSARAADHLGRSRWLVGGRSDRIGVRLEGAAVEGTQPTGAASEPVVRGSVQLPPGGRPVIFLADHPVTGGYPVVGVVHAGDVDRVAQLRPGQGVGLDFDPPWLPDRPGPPAVDRARPPTMLSS